MWLWGSLIVGGYSDVGAGGVGGGAFLGLRGADRYPFRRRAVSPAGQIGQKGTVPF